MGHLHKLNKDYNMRFFFFKGELDNVVFKYYINTALDADYKKYMFYKFLNRFHLNSSSSRIVNRCLVTSRAGGIVRKYRLSRMTFKEFVDKSYMAGFRRITW